MTIVRWAGAAAVVCSLHVGGVMLALMYWPEKEADDPAGTLMLELAPLPTVARLDSPPVAHGPDQRKEAPTEASREALQEVEKDFLRLDPSPVLEPEVALSRPQPEEPEKPKEEEVRNDLTDKNLLRQDRAALPTAPPPVEAESMSMASPGESAVLARLRARWSRSVFRHLERFKLYPDAAARRGRHGTVVVRFRIDRSGHVTSSDIVKSSGEPLLDDEVLAVLKRGSPLPLPPDRVPGSDFVLVGTIDFIK
jgi:periplasmic protein TonB